MPHRVANRAYGFLTKQPHDPDKLSINRSNRAAFTVLREERSLGRHVKVQLALHRPSRQPRQTAVTSSERMACEAESILTAIGSIAWNVGAIGSRIGGGVRSGGGGTAAG